MDKERSQEKKVIFNIQLGIYAECYGETRVPYLVPNHMQWRHPKPVAVPPSVVN